jgi:TatD DNase family protein
MIDSHCHLNDERFSEDLAETCLRAHEAGVRKAVVIGYDLASSRRAVELAQDTGLRRTLPLFAVVGVSTHEAAIWNEEAGVEIRRLLTEDRVVGLGETGFDYYYPEPSRADQERSLVAQLSIANEAGVPVVFHLRDAAEDFFRVLDRENHSSGGVLHCFTGDEKTMRMGVERGLFVSFSGIVTFKKSEDLRAVARATPIERLLVETDAPYLAPIPHRGKRCEPAHGVETAGCLAELKGMTYEDFESQMESNLESLFPRIGAQSGIPG